MATTRAVATDTGVYTREQKTDITWTTAGGQYPPH